MGNKERTRWRCGNFVIRRVEVPTLGEEDWQLSESKLRAKVRKGEIGTVPAIELSNLDGSWCVRLAPGTQMESLVSSMLGEEEFIDNDWLGLVLTNLLDASSIPNGYYHQALMLVTAAYINPSLISGGKFSRSRRAFNSDVKRLREAFLSWRKEYDEFIGSQPVDDENDLRRLEAEDLLDDIG